MSCTCTQHDIECEHHSYRLLQVCPMGNSKNMSGAAVGGVIFQNGECSKILHKAKCNFPSVYMVVVFLGQGGGWWEI